VTGSQFGAVCVAAREPGVKTLVSQVSSLDSRWTISTPAVRTQAHTPATARTRGKLGYPEPGAKIIGNLTGAPILEKLAGYAPIEDIDRTKAATSFLLAEKEELVDNKEHGLFACKLAKGPKKLVIVPNITHYGIYDEARARAQKAAIDWFDEHLKK
jgi:alpha-beta hydrolase superfamily lysophospholipase